jgi:HEAT repeat protein
MKNPKNIFFDIKCDNFNSLSTRVYSEEELKTIGQLTNKDRKRAELVKSLIINLPSSNDNYDWNIGSILQHIDADLIINILKKIDQKQLYGSIGLTWVLGEFKNTHPLIIDFLYSTVKNSTNSNSWWRAAFSLERLKIEEAVSLLKISLKHHKLNDIDFYLKNLDDKKSIIAILILSSVDSIENKIYPKIKKTFLESNSNEVIINCCWLIGRLKLIDQEIYQKLIKLIGHNNYELKYYTFFALQNNPTELLRLAIEKSLTDPDPLIRRMAVRGLLNIGNEKSLGILEESLYKEKEPAVISEISKTIYNLKNPVDRDKLLIKIKSCRSENGMISDKSDKWYSAPAIYRIFSEAEDPENICFNLIQRKIKNKRIINPIDLATGTGRMIWEILDNIKFNGKIIGVDMNKNMCEFLEKTIKRERKYTNNIQIINSKTKDLGHSTSVKSNFIISSFGFPSKINNKNLCFEELKAVYSLLLDDGLFFTIGWDESFNDELNMMWYKYIPDSINAKNFEEWRKKRCKKIVSPRNCSLTWFKEGINVPLQFSSLREAVYVMGYLFGQDAIQYIIKNNKTEWSMSMGITCNTKDELKKIIENYKKNKHERSRSFI